MKNFIIILISILYFQNIYAAPASTSSTQKLIDSLDIDQYIQDSFSNDSIYDALTSHIITLYHPVMTNDEPTRKRIKTAIRNYYLGSEFKAQYHQNIFDIYQQNYTEEETLVWIDFFNQPIGKSILANTEYSLETAKVLTQLFNQDHVLSEKSQKKLSELIHQFIED